MPHHFNNQMVSASDFYSTKPELSGIKSHKLISGMFEGKCSSDYESAWSPTSPLDFRLFSSLGNPFAGSSSKGIRKVKQKSWDSGKVGLSIVHSLDDHHTDSSRILLPSPDSKNIVFGAWMRSGNPKPHLPNPTVEDIHLLSQPCAKKFLPENDKPTVGFEIGHDVIDVMELQSSSSVDAYCSGTGDKSVNNDACQEIKQTPGSLNEHTESDIDISEYYTCVTSHGPNPKTTHLYGDEVLESVENSPLKKHCCGNKKESIFEIAPIDLTTPIDVLPSNDFLSVCISCSKKLDMGKNIYMYRGYKAFCSNECRFEEIDRDEEMEEEAEDGAEAPAKSDSTSDSDLSKKESKSLPTFKQTNARITIGFMNNSQTV